MATVDPPVTSAVPSCGAITMTIFSAIGLGIWGTSIGFLLGRNSLHYLPQPVIISILINIAMIYTACRLIFLVANTTFPSAAGVEDLHQCVARMVAITVVGFSAWGTSVAWLVQYDTLDPYVVYHLCNYGFIISAVVAGLAGGILSQARATRRTITGPVHAVIPIAHQPSQAHYNQAYMHHYGQQRV